MHLIKETSSVSVLLLVLAMFPGISGNISDVRSMDDWNDQLIKAGRILTVAQFHVKWCSYCRMMRPVFIKIAQQYPEVIFLNVEVDENQDIAWKNGIRSVPTYKYFKNASAIDSVTTINPLIITDLIFRLK